MGAVAATLLAGCETTPDSEEEPISAPVEAAGQPDPIRDLIAGIPERPQMATLEAQGYIGQPVAMLEEQTGQAALSRKEGANEFRRYDLGACRLYAVVIPAGGNVSSLAVGPAFVGSVMPSFAECLAARLTTGS